MQRFLGLFSFFFAILAILASLLLAPDLPNSKTFAYSDFGVDPRTALIFNLGLILSAIINIFYLYFLKNHSTLFNKNKSAFYILIAGAASLAGIGLFPYTLNHPIHLFMTLSFFGVYPAGIATLGLQQKNLKLVVLMIINVVGAFFIWRYFAPEALAETYSIAFSGVHVTILYLMSRRMLVKVKTESHKVLQSIKK